MGAAEQPRSVSVAPERLQGWLDRFTIRHGTPRVVSAGDFIIVSAPDGARARVRQVWPPDVEVDPIVALVAAAVRPRTIGALIVRKQAHAVGVFNGETLLAGHHRSHYVQGRTKAGGWSQQRYARRRDHQSSRSFDSAAQDAASFFLPRLDRLEGLATGGDSAAVKAVLAHPALTPLAKAGLRQLGVFAVPDPNARVLGGFGAVFRKVSIELNELA